jgi:hypothetical protein
MAINQAIWNIDNNKPTLVQEINLKKEEILENLIQADPNILSEDWLIIGRQVRTEFGKEIDFLAIDRNGNIIIVELKKDRTPREVVAQGLDYASWVKKIGSTTIAEIFSLYLYKYKLPKESLSDAYKNKFNFPLDEENINQGHQIVIVCSELDPATERIVTYLNESDIPINVVFFKVFEDKGNKYLSRVWFIEPQETEENTVKQGEKVPWNGEYYVSFGDGASRKWEDAMKFGFISAGGGKWYSKTLNKLDLGNRIWVNIPGTGFVGVGKVIGKPAAADKLVIKYNGKDTEFNELPTKIKYFDKTIKDDLKEYLVPVEWIKCVPKEEAVSEFGFFGNQNSVAEPKSKKWEFTIKTLKEKWNIF